ncbi:MAG: hypothetical protein BWY67_02089 [Bacteroidetes bacterium ADurb.Bin397]|nr:MAG: hypothetical protein BWY67_02089 [Bacteroidetes bacterium ADurb.Bin397]
MNKMTSFFSFAKSMVHIFVPASAISATASLENFGISTPDATEISTLPNVDSAFVPSASAVGLVVYALST